MTATALSVASVHLTGINASRKKCGLAPLTLVEAEREFADVARVPFRAKAVAPRTTSNTGAADALWGGIITKLNASLSSSRPPIGARRASPTQANTKPTERAVDWGEIASDLNREAGLSDRRAR